MSTPLLSIQRFKSLNTPFILKSQIKIFASGGQGPHGMGDLLLKNYNAPV